MNISRIRYSIHDLPKIHILAKGINAVNGIIPAVGEHIIAEDVAVGVEVAVSVVGVACPFLSPRGQILTSENIIELY